MSLGTLKLISIAIAIACGVFCSRLARDRKKNPMLWFHMGFFFGVIGIALFYVKLMIDNLKKPKLAEETASLQSERPNTENKALEAIQPKSGTALEDREWYLAAADNKSEGPITFVDLKGRYEKGQINDETQIWSEGMQTWMPLSKLAYLKVVLTS